MQTFHPEAHKALKDLRQKTEPRLTSAFKMNQLLSKTITGFFTLMIALALVLFVSAGTLAYWQAWVYLVVFALCVIVITAYLFKYDQRLLASRVSAGPTAEVEKSQKVIQSLASLFFIGLFVVAGLDFRFHWSTVSFGLVMLANGFVIISFAIIFLVFKENSYTSAIIEIADEQRVITTGPYRIVRHPMYAGAFLLLIFSALALGSWVAVPCAVCLMLSIVLRLIEEEKFLSSHLAGYDAYRAQVRYRLIPYLW